MIGDNAVHGGSAVVIGDNTAGWRECCGDW